MSGSLQGVQTFIKQDHPDARYIHCHVHPLNLIMMKTASINIQVKIFFENIQRCLLFSQQVHNGLQF